PMNPIVEALTKILAELIVLSTINLFPLRRLRSIDRNIKGLRRDHRHLRSRHGRRLNDHERRIDRHDEHAGIDTRDHETGR
ncbi:MAG TPA: hypothetical protein VFW87_02480, partial [Pirellulales bacterium]|nr:hypothetical protein [Pirellulales bacterium]